jgi:hypothetical protein
MVSLASTSTLFFILTLTSSVSSSGYGPHGRVTAQERFGCWYSEPIVLDDNNEVTLEHFINVADETITLRMTYTGDEHRWLSVGVNTAGTVGMAPALVVIGRQEDGDDDNDSSATASVHRYSLTSDSRDASGVTLLDDVHGHLKSGGSSFVQSTTEDGLLVSVLEFTHDLVIRDDADFERIQYQIISAKIPTSIDETQTIAPTGTSTTDDDNPFDSIDADDKNEDDGTTPPSDNIFSPVSSQWIWAVGGSNNRWFGSHRMRGSFLLSFDENNCIRLHSVPPTATPTAILSDEPSMAPSTTPSVAATVVVDGMSDNFPSSSASGTPSVVGSFPPLTVDDKPAIVDSSESNNGTVDDKPVNGSDASDGDAELDQNLDNVGGSSVGDVELDQNLSVQDSDDKMWVSVDIAILYHLWTHL